MNNSKKDLRRWISDLECDVDMLASLVDYLTDIDRMTSKEREALLTEWATLNPGGAELLQDAFGIEADDSHMVFLSIPVEVAVVVSANSQYEAEQRAKEQMTPDEIITIFKNIENVAYSMNFDMINARYIAP